MRALSALQLLLFLLGLASLVCIPEHFVQNVYVDENALMPNGAFPQITPGTVEFHRAAVALQSQLARASAENASVPIAAGRLVALLSALDFESVTFRADRIAPIDRQRWASCMHAPSSGGARAFADDEAVVVSSVLRAVKGDGKESIVLVAEWWLDANAERMWPSAPAIAVALQRHLQNAPWLSKDIILAIIVLPSAASSAPASSACRNLVHHHASAWFAATQSHSGHRAQSSSGGGASAASAAAAAAAPRLGAVSVALALDIAPGAAFDRISLNPVGQHGLLPNMDALSAFIHCSTARSLPVVFMQSRAVSDTISGAAHRSSQQLANAVAWTLELLPSAVLQSARKWIKKHRSMLNHATTSATGGMAQIHSIFLRYNIDAFSAQTMTSGRTKIDAASSVVNLGSALESYLRTHSNLVEKLHHSLRLYVLVSDRHFSSMSKYTVCFVLFLLPLGLQALYLYLSAMHPATATATATAAAAASSHMASTVPTGDNEAAASGAARLVSAAIMWMANLLFCLAVLVAPAAVVRIRGEFSFLSTLPAPLFLVVAVVGLVILPLIVSACLPRRQIDWRITKAITLCFVCIATGALFVMNFPLAVAVASTVGLVLLPASASLPRSFAGRLLSLLVHVSMFAAAALFILTVSHLIGAGDAFQHQIGNNWNLIEIATIGLGLFYGGNRPVSISPLQLPVLASFLLVGPCVVLAAQLVQRHAWALLTCRAADSALGKQKSE